MFAQLHTLTNFSFLTGASHPAELVQRAAELGYSAIAITDDCSLAGIVKAHVAAQECGIKLLVGSRFCLSSGVELIALAPHSAAYAELSGFITLARRRAPKGEYEAHLQDLRFRLQSCLMIWVCSPSLPHAQQALELHAEQLARAFAGRLWLGINHQLGAGEQAAFGFWQSLGQRFGLPLVAAGEVLMHCASRKPLQDALTAIRLNVPVKDLGSRRRANGEAYLKSPAQLQKLYAPELLAQTRVIADLCEFSLDELRYQYPRELVPEGFTSMSYLREMVNQGKRLRWPEGTSADVEKIIEKELTLIEEQRYEYFFLTVHDIVRFARSKNILCQGRGSAANSVVCYCLGITEIAPGQINVLFERFISKERDEPPDIDVDFEHERREEVIQYIYQKYGRERAALAATVITYRQKSAMRDLGKALGFSAEQIEQLSGSLAWWDRRSQWRERLQQQLASGAAASLSEQQIYWFFTLVDQLLGFPRHLSQHVGGFVIAEDRISDLVPVENASMPERTIIQWDKDDLESMRLLKVDVLALGMLTALRKTLAMINDYQPGLRALSDIPREDAATYAMLSQADSIGVFQVESRAQMSMLPRLQPRCFYDLVIQIAIIRPGPIQGGMVHPFLRRRHGQEPVSYPNPAIESVLAPTLGVPIFQEQAIRLAMVAAGFSGGEADQLRRAMAAWGKNSRLMEFEEKFINGMLANGYSLDFAQRLFEQIKGFGGYGFPESHSASFALLCYASSWCKRHHPAAFYCALLNSQPMGFYSPSQLMQDAKRHGVLVLPVDINASRFDSCLELVERNDLVSEFFPNPQPLQAIRLGFHLVKSLDTQAAQTIAHRRGDQPFSSLQDLVRRAGLSKSDLEHLAAADALLSLSGNRHLARWQAAAIKPHSPLLDQAEAETDHLITPAPGIEKDMLDDYASTGLSLRIHPMALLRNQPPFNRCISARDLLQLAQGRFARVAGVVTGRQRPGTAKGTVFVTLEDETGNINVVVWQSTQEHFRAPLLEARLLIVKGVVEVSREPGGAAVVHLLAGHLQDVSDRLARLAVSSRDFH
jgi:error-prone DNA polymerase